MAITKLNSLAIPPDTVVESDISFPLDSASFTGDLTVDTDTLVVDSTNNRVGIGTGGPSEALTVSGSGTSARISLTDSDSVRASMTGLLEFDGTDNRAGFIGYDAGNMSLYAAVGDIKLSTAGAEYMRLDNSGVLSIKETGGAANLQLYSSGTSGFLKGNRGVTTEIELGAADITFDSGGSPIMTMKNGGNVGIGETGPTTGNLVVATGSRTLGGTITARTSFSGSGWTFGDVIGRFAFDAEDGPQDYTGTIESVVSQGGNFPYKTDIIFTTQTNGNRTEKLRIQENGGISFNGDTAAANALDDYEEGTWTPTYLGSGTNPTITYDRQFGSYVKIGKTVILRFELRTDAVSGGSGNVYIGNIPFAPTNVSGQRSGNLLVGYTAAFLGEAPQTGYINGGDSRIILQTTSSSGAGSDMSYTCEVADLGTGGNNNFMMATLIYEA